MSKENTYKSVLEVDTQLLEDITGLIHDKSDGLLRNIIADLYDFDIAVIIENLEEDDDAFYLFSLLEHETASNVLLEISDERKDEIVERLEGTKLSSIVSEMYSDDAADFVSELDEDDKHEVLQNLDTIDKEDSQEVRELLQYDETTAGGIMAKEFVVVHGNKTVAEAVKEIQDQADEIDQLYNVWVVDSERKLVGIISLKRIIILMKEPDKKIIDVMNPDVISVRADVDQQEVANIFRSYDLVSLPVVDLNGRVIGKISSDDIMDVMEEEYSEDVAKMVGSDSEELEKKSPFQIAKLRLPWVLITLGIEFIGGFVISQYDATLQRVILLASFMPVISAIAGNTGLQSAAIVVRALDTGLVSLDRWFEPVKRQLQTTTIIGLVVGFIVAVIGYVWEDTDKLLFGITVGISMFISINLSGVVGTIFPFLSKKMGFDPAITSGPFETAFQDVIGVSIFLTLATWLLTHPVI
jgi:magnesium transporter